MALDYVPDEPPAAPRVDPQWNALGVVVTRTVARLTAAGIPMADAGNLFELLVPAGWPPPMNGPVAEVPLSTVMGIPVRRSAAVSAPMLTVPLGDIEVVTPLVRVGDARYSG